MQKQSLMKCSQAQLINYFAVDIAEKLMPAPQQEHIDAIEKDLELYISVLKSNREH